MAVAVATHEDLVAAAQDTGVQLYPGQIEAILDYLNAGERVACYVPANRLRVPRRIIGYPHVSILVTGSRFIAVIRKRAPQTHWEFIDFPYKSQTGRARYGGMRRYPVRSWSGQWEMQDGGMCKVSSPFDDAGRRLFLCTTTGAPTYHMIQGNDPNPPPQPYVPLTALERRTLSAVHELSLKTGDAYVATPAIANRLGDIKELPEVLHRLANKRLLQHGKDRNGVWGNRPSSKGMAVLKHA